MALKKSQETRARNAFYTAHLFPRCLVHLSRSVNCEHALSVRPSVVRCLSSLTFHIFDFSFETTEQNATKFERKQDLNVLYQVCVFRVDRKKRWPPWPLIGWDIFDLSETAERNSKKLDRKQDYNILYHVCVFRADRKNKMAALASDWLRHFRLLWNHWKEFKETWPEARLQHPLPSLCFSGRSEKQDGRPGLWLAEAFSTSPLKPLNRIQRNLTGSKLLTSSTTFVFFGPIRKKDGRPGLWLAETFSNSPLKPLYGFQRSITGSKITTASAKFVFSTSLKSLNRIQRNLTESKISMFYIPDLCFWVIQKWPSWSCCQKGGTLYSCVLYVARWASSLNVPWQHK